MDDRTRRLGQHAARTASAWGITALGPVPADPAARRDWERQAAPIAAYREMYGYGHPGDPIGPEPSQQAPDQRAAWYQAFLALGPAAGPDVRAMPDVEYLKHLTSETGDSLTRGVEVLKSLGCEVREISLPATDYAIACYYIIATAEASSNLARYDGVRYTARAAGGHPRGYVPQHTRRGVRSGM